MPALHVWNGKNELCFGCAWAGEGRGSLQMKRE